MATAFSLDQQLGMLTISDTQYCINLYNNYSYNDVIAIDSLLELGLRGMFISL